MTPRPEAVSARPLPSDTNKPHRCPACSTCTDNDHRSRWAVVTCCACGVQFTRYPAFHWVLPRVGVVCHETYCPNTTKEKS